MTAVLDWIALGCLLGGALLSFAAGVGLVRFPDLLSRMHTAAKPQILGLLLILVGIGLRMAPDPRVGILVLVALFQLLTVPVAAHIAGRAAYRTGRVRRDLLAIDELRDELAEDSGR
ncbi:monovalent cation/H(+) antiporter subunit G [Marinitenerispora sediminis]|uniref:Na+/H+ antiporter subunit G n=1 Tax=Marinitenerispora sediminis TaxID=1931232 RepID=A0A368TCD6_9ACTN|nr:monovalent cation/H(+) antiporter subunit G [Marinitenerispora sediminis]RCV54767.1 Na+/H+ antiporter subunit G [Marinitenerispora sediminis]RCV60557.1 Na+/H+ antiporter subunit G [Marinitenerispora sediminis]RCV61023.1 Na+/H+ antiporter subunit G [Marinitenerispora sediminis]